MWTIEGEEVIVLGDTTTHGGQVITAAETVFYLDRRVARVGDQVTCPKCKGVHTIASGAPDAYALGMQIARNGDMVSCGARLISGSGAVDGMTSNDARRLSEPEVYDEQIRVRGEDGSVMINVPYFIECQDGTTFQGFSDEHGCCGERIYTEQQQEISVYLGLEALQRWHENDANE